MQCIINCIIGNSLIYEATGTSIEIMNKIFKKKVLTNTEKQYIYKGLLYMSQENPICAQNIINTFETNNEFHIGIMLMILFSFIPQYDLTRTYQLIDSTTYTYISFKHISEKWMEEVYRLFMQTSQIVDI